MLTIEGIRMLNADGLSNDNEGSFTFPSELRPAADDYTFISAQMEDFGTI
jgi:hypothetical protein